MHGPIPVREQRLLFQATPEAPPENQEGSTLTQARAQVELHMREATELLQRSTPAYAEVQQLLQQLQQYTEQRLQEWGVGDGARTQLTGLRERLSTLSALEQHPVVEETRGVAASIGEAVGNTLASTGTLLRSNFVEPYERGDYKQLAWNSGGLGHI